MLGRVATATHPLTVQLEGTYHPVEGHGLFPSDEDFHPQMKLFCIPGKLRHNPPCSSFPSCLSPGLHKAFSFRKHRCYQHPPQKAAEPGREDPGICHCRAFVGPHSTVICKGVSGFHLAVHSETETELSLLWIEGKNYAIYHNLPSPRQAGWTVLSPGKEEVNAALL